jgi:plastocyanin
MTRIDSGGAILALLTGFILSAGLVGFVLAAGGYQLPFPAPRPLTVTAPGPAVAPPPAAVQAPAVAAPAAQAAEVQVVATDLKFNPATIQAKVGQPIKIVLQNKGANEHDIHFPALKADKPAASLQAHARTGQTATLEFTPTAKGSYEYICTIPGHKEAGMKGKINVVD